MPIRVAIPDVISPSYFPAIAAVELGFFAEQGLDADIELVFPVTDAYKQLRDGRLDYVGGAAHAPLYVFEGWRGCKLLCALSQNMYWYLVVRSDLDAQRGDLAALRGLRIGAAPGPVDGLRRMLEAVDINPDADLDIVPVPAANGAGISFGVTAAKALEQGEIDGFWANGMGAEVAIRNGTGHLLIDARRGDGPPGAEHYTFPALVTTEQRISEEPEQVAAAIRAVVSAQRALRQRSDLAAEAARDLFPESERGLIAGLIQRDAPYYDPTIPEDRVIALNDFGRYLGILGDDDVAYDRVVSTGFTDQWDVEVGG